MTMFAYNQRALKLFEVLHYKELGEDRQDNLQIIVLQDIQTHTEYLTMYLKMAWKIRVATRFSSFSKLRNPFRAVFPCCFHPSFSDVAWVALSYGDGRDPSQEEGRAAEPNAKKLRRGCLGNILLGGAWGHIYAICHVFAFGKKAGLYGIFHIAFRSSFWSCSFSANRDKVFARDHGFCQDSISSIAFSWESKGTRTNATRPRNKAWLRGLELTTIVIN